MYQRILISTIALSISCVGCSQSKEPPTAKTIAPVKVRTVSVQEQPSARTTTQPATVHAYHETEIRPRVSGYILEVNVDIGDVVESGKPLASIDVPEMEQQREILIANIARKEAEETRATSGIKLAAANIEAAKAELKEAKSQLKSVDASLTAAEAALNRVTDLVGRGSLEARMQDEAREKRDSLVAQREALGSAVVSSEAAVVVAQANQSAAEADLKAAQADTKIAEQELKEVEVLMNFATLTAPFKGVITQRNAEPGDLVSKDDRSAALFVISKVDVVRVHVSVPERTAAFINRGDTLKLTFPSFEEEKTIDAKITRTSGSLDPNTRMMLVEAEVTNKDGKLIPGMFGQASIPVGAVENVAVLPARAVRFTETGDAYVYALKDNEVSIVNVTTGTDDGSTIEIVSGLDAGSTVIDAHLQRFTDGQEVEVLN